MPGEVACPPVLIDKIDGIPLYLIPKAVAEQIKLKRESVFLIRVERRFNHRYTVIVESRDEHEGKVQQKRVDHPG